jgi:hypothetical protein
MIQLLQWRRCVLYIVYKLLSLRVTKVFSYCSPDFRFHRIWALRFSIPYWDASRNSYPKPLDIGRDVYSLGLRSDPDYSPIRLVVTGYPDRNITNQLHSPRPNGKAGQATARTSSKISFVVVVAARITCSQRRTKKLGLVVITPAATAGLISGTTYWYADLDKMPEGNDFWSCPECLDN